MSKFTFATILLCALTYTTVYPEVKADKRVKVYFGIYFNSVSIDNTTGLFEADFYWWMRFADTKDSAFNIRISSFEYINGINTTQEEVENKILYDPYIKDSCIYITGKTHGKFRFDADYHLYPLDAHKLKIKIESTLAENSECIFVPDTNAGSKFALTKAQQQQELQIQDMEIRDLYYSTDSTSYQTNFGDVSLEESSIYSSLNYTLEVSRNYRGYAFKIVVPLIIILLMAYLVFFIPPSNIEVVSGMSVTSLLSAIAIQLTTSEPPCDSPMISDKIYYLCYFLITLSMAQNIYSFNLDRNHNKVAADRVERIGRIYFPVFFVIGIIIILVGAY